MSGVLQNVQAVPIPNSHGHTKNFTLVAQDYKLPIAQPKSVGFYDYHLLPAIFNYRLTKLVCNWGGVGWHIMCSDCVYVGTMPVEEIIEIIFESR